MPKKVFVSWSGEIGKMLAETLKETILDDAELAPWVSSHSLEAGRPWFAEIERAANECEVAIGCLTPGSAKRPWVNFEAGMLFGRLRNFKILLLNERLSGPLAQLQAVDGTKFDDLERLLKPMLSDSDRCERHLKRVFPSWKSAVDNALRSLSNKHEIEAGAENLRDAAVSLAENPVITNNGCLRQIMMLSLADMKDVFGKMVDTYSASQLEYPSHLIRMQQQHKAVVRAVALLQQEEQFWQKRPGREIRDTANHSSERVFIVRTPGQLEEHWDTILKHARAYRVYVLSYAELARRFEDRFARDFSVIETNGSKVVATYENTSNVGRILYMGNAEAVDEYEKGYAKIIERAVRVDATEAIELDSLKAQVFATKTLSPLDQRPVEMSVYVAIEDYDKHEEEHAYYIEMMEAMLSAFRHHWPDSEADYRVLEMGAGTGIFTRRVAGMSSIAEVVALEIDWACHQKLSHNVRSMPKVKAYNEDSRRFNPVGRFHAVFSSFADHHIKPQDKIDYLRNVKRNLAPGGVFIVGDEFLRPHRRNDVNERRAALEAYHGHIIDKAKTARNDVLVALETAALHSGLNEIGDFKVSCAEYEEHLRDGGFTFKRVKIGPADDRFEREIGGVYVYVSQIAITGSNEYDMQ